MEILGLLTIALVAGTLARTAYRDALPADVTPSFLIGAAGVAMGHGVSTLTGVGAMNSVADPATWLTALTCAFLAVAVSDALRVLAPPVRGIGPVN